MWLRKSMLVWFVLLLLFLCPLGLCQVQQSATIKGYLSVDSTGVRTTQISPSLEPMRIGLSDSQPATTSSGGYIAPGYTLPVTVNESQWVVFHFSATEWNWFVRKPDIYAAKVLTGSIESNGGVMVDFENFGPLLCTDGSGQVLGTHYAIAPVVYGIELLTWMTPQELNNYQINLDEPPIVPFTWALWQKVVVDNSAKAAEFEDEGFIGIALLNNLVWFESEEIDRNSISK
jgi:hypothetical protein